MDIIIIVCVALNLIGVVLGALFWERHPRLRIVNIVFSTVSGFLYAIFEPDISGFTEVMKIVGVSVVIGFGFFFSLWIQCKD